MQHKRVQQPAITLVGLVVNTNNRTEMEPKTSKIAKLIEFYWTQQVADRIQNRTNPGVSYAVYTNYHGDEHGDYVYLFGEEVSSLKDQDLESFKAMTIPASNYMKFTTEQGKIPDVVLATWQDIWAMNERDFGSKRTFLADFEVYDERAADLDNAIVDIYVGIE